MFKQFLSRLPRKSLETESGGRAESPRLSSPRSNSRDRPSRSGQGACKSNGGNSASVHLARRPSSAVFPASMVAGIEPLVPFNDVPNTEKMNLFVSKVSLCCVTFDFTDPSKNCVEKDVKRRTLLELVEFSAYGSSKFSEPAILALCRMCAVNLFRAFPPNYRSNTTGGGGGGGGENDDDEPMFDHAWPHLQLVYELLLKFVSSSCLDAKVAKKYIDHSFILRLLSLFESEDPRERDYLKNVLHRIYGKFMVHRTFIRKAMNNVFYRFVFEIDRHNGVAELLEIYGSIISGFALPLKEEHKIFLWRVLIPLHKPKSLGVYFQQLSYCVTQFIEKDQKLASVVINGLLKYWPITHSHKEVMFLGELEEILEFVSFMEFQKVMVPLFQRIGCCINSSHFQVAERVLFFWNNDHIMNLIANNRQVIFSIILPVLERNFQNHWNQSVLNLSFNARKMFMEMDGELFLSCLSQQKEEEVLLTLAAEKRKQTWQLLEHAASLQPMAGKTAVLVTPATSTTCYK